MRTRELVTFIHNKVSGFGRPEILSLLNEVHAYIYYQSNVQTERIDPATGMPPLMATTDDTFFYQCPEECWRTISVFTRDLVGYEPLNFNGHLREYTFNRRNYWEWETNLRDATEGVNASITFMDNPGTTTNRFFHLYYLQPPQLSAETIELLIPPKHHLKIARGVIDLIRDEKYGDESAWERFEQRIAPRILADMSTGGRRSSGRTLTQPEYRHYTTYPFLRR